MATGSAHHCPLKIAVKSVPDLVPTSPGIVAVPETFLVSKLVMAHPMASEPSGQEPVIAVTAACRNGSPPSMQYDDKNMHAY
jgi:hypothetical protein